MSFLRLSASALMAAPILRKASTRISDRQQTTCAHRIKEVIRLLAMTIGCFAFASCGERQVSYRYKLTVSIVTPEGLRTGTTVAQVTFRETNVPERGSLCKLVGEALVVSLGGNDRPLIALTTSFLQERRRGHRNNEPLWGRDCGPGLDLLNEIYGGLTPGMGIIGYIDKIGKSRGAHRIGAENLPDLVTLSDIDDLGSIIEVNRNDLAKTFGPGVTWGPITLELTDEPVSVGIEARIPGLSRADPSRFVWTRKGPPASDTTISVFSFNREAD